MISLKKRLKKAPNNYVPVGFHAVKYDLGDFKAKTAEGYRPVPYTLETISFLLG